MENKTQIDNPNNNQIFVCWCDGVEILLSQHNGINNFYTEYYGAKSLCELFQKYTKVIVSALLLPDNLQKLERSMNVIFYCKLGNDYGRSERAQEYLDEIIKILPNEIWLKYIEYGMFFDETLLWSMKSISGNKRWTDMINNICTYYQETKNILKISQEKAEILYRMYNSYGDKFFCKNITIKDYKCAYCLNKGKKLLPCDAEDFDLAYDKIDKNVPYTPDVYRMALERTGYNIGNEPCEHCEIGLSFYNISIEKVLKWNTELLAKIKGFCNPILVDDTSRNDY